MLHVHALSDSCLASLQQALERRLMRSPESSPALRWGMSTGLALPVLTWSLTKPGNESPVEADLGGEPPHVEHWIPLEGGAEPGLAVMTVPFDGDAWTFAGVRTGLLVRRLMEACQLAQDALGQVPERFDARVVDVPVLQFTALWLSGQNSDWFISLLDGSPKGSAPLVMQKNMEQDVLARTEARAAAEAQQQ